MGRMSAAAPAEGTYPVRPETERMMIAEFGHDKWIDARLMAICLHIDARALAYHARTRVDVERVRRAMGQRFRAVRRELLPIDAVPRGEGE